MALHKPIKGGDGGGGTIIRNVNYSGSVPQEVVIPLDIPTYDDDPNVAHPSVVIVHEGFNGYTHWMAFTPWPNSERENPSIVASNDGVNWEVPDGLTNPVAPPSEAFEIGAGYWSDTDLIYNNGELWMYYRGVGSGGEFIVLKISSDGVNWSEQEVVLQANADKSILLSPTIQKISDDLFYMWTVKTMEGAERRFERWTSTDGKNWTDQTECTTPEIPYPWHHDVAWDGTKYHMIYVNNGAWELLYMYSYDGLEWHMDSQREIIPRTGIEDIDGYGYYRSALVPVPGEPTKFDIWANVINGPMTSGYPTVPEGNDKWRILYYKEVDLFGGTTVKEKDVSTIWVPARDFNVSYGSSELKVQNQRLSYYEIKPDTLTKLTTSIVLPKNYKTFHVKLHWYNLGTGVGDVQWILSTAIHKEGQPVTSANSGISATPRIVERASGQYILEKSHLTDRPRSIDLDGEPLSLTIQRSAADGYDTLSNDVAFVGLEITPY